MSLETIRKGIGEGKFICPSCGGPIRKYDKYVEMAASVWDGAGDTGTETQGSKVTLICGSGECSWQERTEYWENYLRS